MRVGLWKTSGYFVWLLVLVFQFVAYLILLFNILLDLLVRDQKTSGWVKALWVISSSAFRT